MDMDNELVSLIVPVFNTSKFLRRCLDSIIHQTYRNFEIILINDGSTDESPAICREYALADNRIVFLNRDNGGQSAARNDGLLIAQGDYIGFVDSDDYIEKDFVECLIRNIRETNAEISICGIQINNEEGMICTHKVEEEKVTLYDNMQAMKLLLEDREFGSHPCNKLFAKRLFNDVVFPIGRVYEDIAIMHIVFGKANKVVVSSASKYNYLIHNASTTHSRSPYWGYSLYKAFFDRNVYVSIHYPKLHYYSLEKAYGIAIGMYIHMIRFKSSPQIKGYMQEIRSFILSSIHIQQSFESISRSRKRDAKLIAFLPFLEKIKYRIYFGLFAKRRGSQ